MIAAYLPIMIILIGAAFALINSANPHFLSINSNDFMWASIPCQIKAILNSVIYFTKKQPHEMLLEKLIYLQKSGK